VSLLVLLALIPAAPVRGAFPGNNGKLVFASRYLFWTSTPWGSDRTEIIRELPRPLDPSWSPNGSKIAYTCERTRKVDSEICISRSNGDGRRIITDNEVWDDYPNWHPDGKHLLFVRRSQQPCLIVLNLQTGKEEELAIGLPDLSSATYSPDGTQIVFTGAADGVLRDVYVMNADGTDLTALTATDTTEDEVDWSPDGTHLVFSKYLEGTRGGWVIHTLDLETGKILQLTTGRMFAVSPSWSPNSKRIAFSGYNKVTPKGELLGKQAIFTIKADGTKLTQVTKGVRRNFYTPDWQPIID
jgi:TolB protein